MALLSTLTAKRKQVGEQWAGATDHDKMFAVFDAKKKQPHATLVRRNLPQRMGKTFTAKDLEAICESSVKLRTVGTSTEHNQSSRSHAILRAEVVTQTLLNAGEKLETARAILRCATP
jgi:hypothetical protein